MKTLFLYVLNLSFLGSLSIIFVILIRIFMKKSPKIFLYLLWVMVFIRLICPFTIETEKNPVSKNIFTAESFENKNQSLNIESNNLDTNENVVYETSTDKNNIKLYNAEKNNISIIDVISIIWSLGMTFFIVGGVHSILKLKKMLIGSIKIDDGIYKSNNISTAFVFGIKPKIYIPENISNYEKDYIILHEKIHISRKDYIVKMAAYLILCIHWFNPLVYVAFHFLEEDMECSCDEAVIKKWV